MKEVYILPTGDEIKDGTVLDLDCGEILNQVVHKYPCAQVTRVCPLVDIEDTIFAKISEIAEHRPSLIVLVGGSGGGHRFSKTLGKDFTHSALEKYLDCFASREIYGKNGHLWTKLICGKLSNTYIINVPGPFVEAQVAIHAFLTSFSQGKCVDDICLSMAEAVFACYPVDIVQKIQ